MADYLKIPEVAHRLDVSEKTARRYVKSGALPSVFIGGAYRVSEADLERFVESAKVGPGKAKAPPSLEPSLFNGLEEERRTLHVELTAIYASQMAARMNQDIGAGHVTREWGLALYGQLAAMLMLINEMLKLFPGAIPEQGLLISESEKQGLEKVSQTADELNEVAKKLGEIVGPTIAEREREALRPTLTLVKEKTAA